MAFRPYLAVAGNCWEALTRYEETFGGKPVLPTCAWAFGMCIDRFGQPWMPRAEAPAAS